MAVREDLEVRGPGRGVNVEPVATACERVVTGAGHSLVRISGRRNGSALPRSAALGTPILLVDDGRQVHRQEPLTGSRSGSQGWRLAFAVPDDWLRGDEVRLALDLGDGVLELPTPVDRLLGELVPAAAPLATPPSAPPQAVQAPVAAHPGRARLAVFAAASLAAAVAVALAVTGGLAADRGPTLPEADEDEAVAFRAVQAAPRSVRGQVTRTDGRDLSLDLAGLQPGHRYVVWLYGNVFNAIRVGSARGPEATLQVRVPPQAPRRPYLDVSDQTGSGALHSGRSVLRLSLSSLRR